MALKNYDELTFSDDFMFCKVLQNNPSLCKELLELILDTEVGDIVSLEKQHPIEITPDGRGVRFDVYAKDDDSVMYDIEMQNVPKDNMPKRIRYSQSLMDLENMERSESFDSLPKSIIIFICNFRFYKDREKHKYTFKNICLEDKSLELGDETEKIVLCSKGNESDISKDMEEFLNYVAGKAPENDFTKRLQSAVEEARMNPRWRKEYMDFKDYIDIAKEEGRKEGLEEGRKEQRAITEKERLRADRAEEELKETANKLDEARKRLEEYQAKYGEI